jgi:hypothetical protein
MTMSQDIADLAEDAPLEHSGRQRMTQDVGPCVKLDPARASSFSTTTQIATEVVKPW